MALRVLLVGLVASLGFELPTGQDLASWAKSGRAWVDARAAELSGLRLEAEQALAGATDGERDEGPAPTTEVASSRADLNFEATVEAMASEFAVDLALMKESTPAEEAVVVVERFQEMPPAATDPGPESDEQASEVLAEVVPVPAPSIAPPAAPASPIEKLSTAVRLTREAVNAWASLIQAVPFKVVDDVPGNSL